MADHSYKPSNRPRAHGVEARVREREKEREGEGKEGTVCYSFHFLPVSSRVFFELPRIVVVFCFIAHTAANVTD
jgi:hypothetical protein